MSPSRSLPPRPHIRQIKKQAKAVLKGHKAADPLVCPRFREFLPHFSNASDAEILGAKVSLRDAQNVVAREYGFDHWVALSAHLEGQPGPRTVEVRPERFVGNFDLHAPSGRLALSRWAEATTELTVALLDVNTGEALGEIPHRLLPQAPQFSPDGNRVAFDGNEIIQIYSIGDGHIQTAVDMPGWAVRWPDWSPDGSSLAFQAGRVPVEGSCIFRMDLADNRIHRLTPESAGGLDVGPLWSPSGDVLAFERRLYDGLDSHSAIWVTDRDGSSATALPVENEWKQSIGRFCWSHDGAHVLAREAWQGKRRRLKAYRVEDLEPVWSFEDERIRSGCFDPHGSRVLCVIDESLRLFGFPSGELVAELPLADLSSVQRGVLEPSVVFDPEDDLLYFLGKDSHLYRWRIGRTCESVLDLRPKGEDASVEVEMDEYRFPGRDGREVPVQRYLPSRPNGAAVMWVQGGPGGKLRPQDPVVMRLLEEGYEVIMPAYRGTDGYGDEHRRANRGEWGRGDVWDVVDCGLDWSERFEAKDRPLALAGFSYGGYLTFLALTYPEAPWSCGVSVSAPTKILPLIHPKALPRDPEEREKAEHERSPMTQAGKTRSPLLMLHGSRDIISDREDLETIQADVKGAGQPCELVVFEEDTHGLPLSQPEMFRQILEFLAEYTQAGSSP